MRWRSFGCQRGRQGGQHCTQSQSRREIRIDQTAELDLGTIHRPHRQQERREVRTLGIGRGFQWRGVAREFPKRIQQSATPIGVERGAELLLRNGGKAKFLNVEHRRIVDPPLDDVPGLRHGEHLNLQARCGDALVARRHAPRADAVAQFDFAIEHGDFGATGGGIHAHQELCPSGHPTGMRRFHLDGDRTAAAGEIDLAVVEPDTRDVGGGLPDDLEPRMVLHVELGPISEAHRGPTQCQRAEAIAKLEELVGRRGDRRLHGRHILDLVLLRDHPARLVGADEFLDCGRGPLRLGGSEEHQPCGAGRDGAGHGRGKSAPAPFPARCFLDGLRG